MFNTAYASLWLDNRWLHNLNFFHLLFLYYVLTNVVDLRGEIHVFEKTVDVSQFLRYLDLKAMLARFFQCDWFIVNGKVDGALIGLKLGGEVAFTPEILAWKVVSSFVYHLEQSSIELPILMILLKNLSNIALSDHQ